MPGPSALNTRAKVLLISFLLILVGLSVHRLFFASPPGPYVAISGRTMGTTWNVKVATDDLGPEELRGLAAAVESRLDRVNELMSTWRPDSEISRFNRQRSPLPFEVAPETMSVLQASHMLSVRSGGAFDATVGPLVELWGFGATDRREEPPAEAELAAVRGSVGYQNLQIDAAAGTLRKLHPDIEVDLSAIAKGFGVDQVAEALEALGHRDYLVEIGGEVRASGARLDGATWRVAIERPESGLRAIHEVIELADRAMATSGDYRNFYEDDGQRLSHTIDPRTGAPIRHGLASVTVLQESAMWADGLATALNVLGPEAGYTWAVKEGVAAYFIVRSSAGVEGSEQTDAAQEEFTSLATPAFEEVVSAASDPQPAP